MKTFRVDNEEYTYTKLNNDVNGNPRYLFNLGLLLLLNDKEFDDVFKEIKDLDAIRKSRFKDYPKAIVLSTYGSVEDVLSKVVKIIKKG